MGQACGPAGAVAGVGALRSLGRGAKRTVLSLRSLCESGRSRSTVVVHDLRWSFTIYGAGLAVGNSDRLGSVFMVQDRLVGLQAPSLELVH